MEDSIALTLTLSISSKINFYQRGNSSSLTASYSISEQIKIKLWAAVRRTIGVSSLHNSLNICLTS